MTFFIYYVNLRYSSTRNPYTRNKFGELQVLLEAYALLWQKAILDVFVNLKTTKINGDREKLRRDEKYYVETLQKYF